MTNTPQYDETTWEGKRAYLEENAGLVFQIGSIIQDRESARTDAELERLWTHLYENLDSFYDRIGPIIDEAEENAGLGVIDARPPFGSSPDGFTRV